MMEDNRTLQEERGNQYENDLFVDIEILKNDPSYIKECVLWIKSSVSSVSENW